jgi:hypothetical protein
MNESDLKRLRREARKKGVEKKVEAFRREHIEKNRAEHVRLTKAIYVELLVTCAPTSKDI